MAKALQFWQCLQEFLDIKGDVVLLVFSSAIIYQIFKGHSIDGGTAACYATAVTAFAATKIKQS